MVTPAVTSGSQDRNVSNAPTIVVTPFVTPGSQDRNVALAWTTWLLREDDTPTTLGDNIMNGLCCGSALGCGCDVLTYLIDRLRAPRAGRLYRGPYAWTRTGGAYGFTIGIATYAYRICHATDDPADVCTTASNRSAQREECMSDPWVKT